MTDLIRTSWAIYEANVQQYRVISITVQSFFLTVGAILYSPTTQQSLLAIVLVCLVAAWHMFVIWIPVVRVRNYIVDYFKYQNTKLFNNVQIQKLHEYCTEREYATNAEKRSRVNKDFFEEPSLNMERPSRKKLDFQIPFLYGIIWVILLVTKTLALFC